ncbi:MAG: radical SAM protein [Dehalococcoidales bacterium]|jgi:MoaA/NifB/PqqE/SkfB family radical SAM enzyme
MALKEFAAKKTADMILPWVVGMSDKDLGRLLLVARKLAPTDYTRSFLDALDRMRREQHPTIEMIRKMIRQTSPNVRKRLINSLLIKELMQGNVIRDQLRGQGLAAPQVYLISPTMRCNLHCPGCYAANYSQKDDLEIEVIDRVITEGKEMGMFWVTILGGEPFVHWHMWEIYRRHQDVLFQVFTNGTLVNKETARKLAETGNVLVIFSLDGFEEETDARRGKGVFRGVMQAMDDLREAGVPFGFSSMITRRNMETIISDEFNDMLVEKGCLIGWHFLYIPVGLNPDVNLMPTAEQRELMRQRGAQRIRNEKPMFVVDFWNDAPVVGGCIAGGRNYFHINASGDVEPCIFVHMAVDNIKQKSLKEAINSPYFKAIRSRQPYGENLLRPCMIIDHPQVLRGLCAECKPYPTDGPECGFITSLADDLDKYSSDAAGVLDPVWEREFAAKKVGEKESLKS